MSDTSVLRDHNNPPEVLELASGVTAEISRYMADNPVVENEDAARGMKVYVDRAKLCIKDLEDERDGKVRPLNEQVAAINGRYRGPRRLLGDLLDEMLGRIQIFVRAEERKRQQAAMELAAKARAAEEAAREAERIERERLDDAAKGEVGVDVAEVIANADQAFDEYTKAERQAILAQRETHVKVGGGFSRAIGMREKEVFHIDSLMKAIQSLGPTPDIEAAVLKAARSHYRTYKKLPDGISRTVERHL
jgi:hypothetical protein